MISIFDIYKVGIGPSSSHTFGTMVASNMFINYLKDNHLIDKVEEIDIHLYGSLALTGYGHGTCLSIELGLEGYTPPSIKPNIVEEETKRIRDEQTLKIKLNDNKFKTISYKKDENRFFHYEALEYHSNGLKLVAKDNKNNEIYSNTYFSIGGGFVLTIDEIKNGRNSNNLASKYEFNSFKELIAICNKEKKTIYDIVLENELQWNTQEEIDKKIKQIVEVMNDCIENGMKREGLLQGTIRLPRRAKALKNKIEQQEKKGINNNIFSAMDYISLWSLAVAEENASFGRLVTAPTNGAAGVIPPVIKFIEKYQPDIYNFESIKRFIIVSGIIGVLCKINATISGAEGGCQAEIGVACAMASAGFVSANGGSDKQIENASVIGLVHNLGLTCDPVGGYVQVPCIERNPVNAVKAIHAGRLALQEKNSLFIPFDIAVKTMYKTGNDMDEKYKETSLGGLAKSLEYKVKYRSGKC